MSSSFYRSPGKAPGVSRDADEISVAHLSQSADGRQTTFETRMAMQRELDSARHSIQTAQRDADETRRHAVSMREEAAVHRSENIRLQDELRSCRARLNAALDSQQDLLQKNAGKHDHLIELQTRNAALLDELASKTALVNYLQEHNAQIEAELQDYQYQASTTARTLDTQLAEASDDLRAARARIAALKSENTSLQATVDALRADMGRKESALAEKEHLLSSRERDATASRDELVSQSSRVGTLQRENDDLKLKVSTLEADMHTLRASESALFDQLRSKDELLTSLQSDNARMSIELSDIRGRANLEKRSLESQLRLEKERERILADDLQNLHRYVGNREVTITTTKVEDDLDAERARIAARRARLDALEEARRTRTYLSLAEERTEGDRLATLARARLHRSLSRSRLLDP